MTNENPEYNVELDTEVHSSHIIQIDPPVVYDNLIECQDDIMENVMDIYIRSNSPMASCHNSDTEEPKEFNLKQELMETINHKKTDYAKVSYEDVERSLSKYYDTTNKFSNEIDILITYMKGQKHLYSNANHVTETKLYALMFTAISLTTFISVVPPFLPKSDWNLILVCVCNAIATLLLTIIKYLKLESSCNTYILIANMYDKLENSLDFTNNKLSFMENESEQNTIVLEKIKELEFKITETKDLCQILIPAEVKAHYPILYNTNIFRFIQKMESHRKTLIVRFKDIKNEIRYILHKWSQSENETETAKKIKEKHRLLYLMELKEKTKAELIEYKNTYNQIDEIFMKEIKYAESLGFFTRPPNYHVESMNPIVKDYLKLVSNKWYGLCNRFGTHIQYQGIACTIFTFVPEWKRDWM